MGVDLLTTALGGSTLSAFLFLLRFVDVCKITVPVSASYNPNIYDRKVQLVYVYYAVIDFHPSQCKFT